MFFIAKPPTNPPQFDSPGKEGGRYRLPGQSLADRAERLAKLYAGAPPASAISDTGHTSVFMPLVQRFDLLARERYPHRPAKNLQQDCDALDP
jgi:hypothetical protein